MERLHTQDVLAMLHNDPTGMGIELILAMQAWRFGLFDLSGIINTNNTFFKLSTAQQYQLS